MAVAYLNYSVRTRTTNTSLSWSHTPSSTPSATVCLIGSYESSTDRVVSVTYGGLALTKIVEAVDTVGEPMRTQIWALTTGVPAGAQTVVITFSDSTSARHVCYVTSWSSSLGSVRITASGVDEGDQTDPAIALSVGGVESMAVGLLVSGHNSETSLTALSGNTVIWAENYFNQCWQLLRQTTASTSDHTIGSTATSEDTAFAAISMTETVARATGVGATTLTGQAPTVTVPVWIAVPAGTITTTGSPPSITSVGKEPGVGAIAVTGAAPGISYVIALGAGSVTMTGQCRAPDFQWPLAAGWSRAWNYNQGPAAISGTTTMNFSWFYDPADDTWRVEPGDLLIATIATLGASDWTTPPAGWTLLPGTQQQTGTYRMEMFFHQPTVEPPYGVLTYTFTCPSASRSLGVIYSYGGGPRDTDLIQDIEVVVGQGTGITGVSLSQPGTYYAFGNGLALTEPGALIICAYMIPDDISLSGAAVEWADTNGRVDFSPDYNSYRIPFIREAVSSTGTGISLGVADMEWPWAQSPGRPLIVSTKHSPGLDHIFITVALRRASSLGGATTRYYLTRGAHPGIMPDYGNDNNYTRGAWVKDFNSASSSFTPVYPLWFQELSQRIDRGGTYDYKDVTVNAQGPGLPETTIPIRTGLFYSMTPPLQAQTLDCDLDISTITFCANSDPSPYPPIPEHDVQWSMHVYVTDAAFTTVKTTLLDQWVDTAAWGPKITGSPTYLVNYANRPFNTLPHLGPYDLADGDRIVIELGVVLTPLSTYPPQTPNPPENWVLLRILLGTEEQLLGGAAPPYFSFSQLITERSEAAPPTNTDWSTALTIASVPYSGAFDANTIDQPMQPLWFKWTAPADMQMYVRFSSVASPYVTVTPTVPLDRTWTYGYVTVLDANTREPFGHVHWDATSGTTYYICLWNYARSLVDTGRVRSGYQQLELREIIPLADNDVIVAAAAKIFRYTSAGELAVVTGPGGTPTGLAIDYSRVPIVDHNDLGGSPHTDHRLLYAVFNADTVYVFDLATLNRGDTYTVDEHYVDLQIPAGTQPTRPSTIATDTVAETSTIYVGWFGLDGFRMVGGYYNSYQDRSGDIPEQSPITKTDITHGDYQPGSQNAQETWYPTLDAGGTNYIELSPDGTTLFYTSGPWYRETPTGGQTVYRWDVVNGVQLPDFVTLANGPGPTNGVKGLFPLPITPTTPGGGLLVCSSNQIVRLDAAANIVQTYTPVPAPLSLQATDVELQSDGQYFWMWDAISSTLFKFDMATGNQVLTVRVPVESGSSNSFVIYRLADYPTGPGGTGAQTGGGGIVIDGASGSGTGSMTATRRAGCIIFEACPMGTLEDECPPVDCISICLSPEQEQFG